MNFTSAQEDYIQHEVRIRVVETGIASLTQELKDIRRDNFIHFATTIGIIVTLFGGIILTKIFT